MRSELQRQASRINGSRSKGPADRSRVRFNGLKHGLRAEHVDVLPGESRDEFEAELDGWRGDWQPMTHTRAVLVDLAAVASFRLRRSIRAGSAVRSRLADDAGRRFDDDRLAAVERAIDRFEDDPGAALSLLGSTALGIDRLLTSWGELDASLEGGPAGWDQRFHLRLMILLGHPHGTPLFTAGPVPIASARLLASRKPGARPLPKGEAEATVAALRRTAAEAMARLRERRNDAPDPAPARRRAMEAATADTSHELRLIHRYEMDHERSLRWALRQLMALEKSGADLRDEPEPGPEPEPEAVAAAPAGPAGPEESGTTIDTSSDCGKLASVGAAAPTGSSGSLGAGSRGPVRARDDAPARGPEAPPRGPSGPGGARSPR